MSPLKAFINERKHQKLPRKAVKQKKTHQVVARSHSTERPHDCHPIQEFSSQSSSFDITGPETPSPVSESDTSVLQVDNHSETSQVEMDPHFARLLGSLALSAAASESFTNEKSTKAAVDEATSIVSSHATNSDDSPYVSHAHGIHQYKVSSPLPSQAFKDSQQASVSSRTHIHDHSTLDSPHAHKSFSNLKVRPEPSSNGITFIEEDLPPLSNDRTTLTSALTPPSQPRRATSTADILPYLTRAADDVPISATRLKQLSLLETVADESARMSSAIAARAATNPVVNGYPLSPQSVPPQSMMLGNTRDSGLIYSSDHPRVPSHALGFQPVYNSLENNFRGEDVSQFRSRTSQSIHRNLTHNPSGSINIHQSHLLATLNGSRSPSLNASQYGPPTHNASMYPRQSQMFHSALQPPSSTMTGFNSSNRGLHPTTVYPPYNPSLLSILNTRSSQPPTVPAPFHQ